MKTSLIFCFILICSVSMFAQPMQKHQRGPKERMEELERIKLLEVLDLNEEDAIRFFLRKKDFRDAQREFMDQRDLILLEMELAIQKEKSINEFDYEDSIKRLSSMEKKIASHREEFIKSLSDLLTKEQIAKLIVFESKFRQELKDALKQRRGRG